MMGRKLPPQNETCADKEQYIAELISRLDIRIKKLELLSKRYSNFRLFLFLFSVLVLALLYFFGTAVLVISILLMIVAAFSVTVHLHNKIDKARGRAKTWKEIKSVHLAKIHLDWQNIPKTFYSDAAVDPVEADLNLTGNQSLHQLINIAASKQGKELLRKFLFIKEPVYNEVIERQNLVKELLPLNRFRDKLQLLSYFPSKRELDGTGILKWLEKTNAGSNGKKYLFGLAVLAPVNVVLFLFSFYYGLVPVWPYTILIYASIYYFGNKKKKKLVEEFEFLKDELGKFSSILEFIENYPFPENSKLRELCNCYLKIEMSPGKILRKISSSFNVLSIRNGNPLVWGMIRIIFPIDFYYNYKLDKYKEIISNNFETWLNTWYNLEALNSLANFAWLNPEYSFPVISIENGGILNSEQLGHPLILSNKKITNDFSVSEIGEINLITGSNMSGKSTFLRTLGINLCLAYAGAPVNASSFECSLCRLFTCIKVSDSVVDGISYFYAEVKRLKALLDEAEKENNLPLFFLIDEIFRGTNNIERLKGSMAFINALSLLPVAGALATHDLELVKLESEIKGLKNFHFKEQIKNDRMSFDYKIQPGPCPTTNALKIMKIEGLPTGD